MVQLKPVQQALPVPAYRLQPHPLRILLIYRRLELQVLVKLTLTQVLKGDTTGVAHNKQKMNKALESCVGEIRLNVVP